MRCLKALTYLSILLAMLLACAFNYLLLEEVRQIRTDILSHHQQDYTLRQRANYSLGQLERDIIRVRLSLKKGR